MVNDTTFLLDLDGLSVTADNIAKTTRAIRDVPEHAAWIWGITDSPLLPGT